MTEWSGLLEWSTRLDPDYWNATPTKLFNIIHVYCSMASHLEKQLKNKSKVVWGAMPNPGTQTRSKVKNISNKVTSHTDSKATCLVPSLVPRPSLPAFNVTHSACLAREMYLHTKQYTVSMPDNGMHTLSGSKQ